MSHSERELPAALARELGGRDDLTVTELVRLAIELDVPAADVLAELQRRQERSRDG